MPFLPFIFALAALLPGAPLKAADTYTVANPHVSTDKSVDCSSIDRILAGLVREGMSDEQKVLAVFNWIRRVLYHGDGPEEFAFDFHKMVNVLGNGSCLRQTTPLALLLGRLGYESESWVHDGHHMIQVKYGGRWHCLDPHMNFYVYDRSVPAQIASLDELRADSALAFDAVKEGRAAPGYLLCGDSPRFFTGSGEWMSEGGWPKMKVEEPFGGIKLRRGESYKLTWMPGPYYFKRAWQLAATGPYHTCGPQDRQDNVNWPLYEPHAAVIGNLTTYRHWGSGKIVYQPDLQSDHYLDAVVSKRNLSQARGKGLAAVYPQNFGEIVFSVNCPYVITSGSLKLKMTGRGRISASSSTNKGESWASLKLEKEGDFLDAEFVDEVNGSFDGYWLKLSIEDRAAISSLILESCFELNPYSLPYLVPGENTVRLEGDQFGSPLTVEWRYAEGPEWKEIKSAYRTFTSPGEFVIEVKGEKYPRNVSLTLSVAP